MPKMILRMAGYILYQTSLVMSYFPPTAFVAASVDRCTSFSSVRRCPSSQRRRSLALGRTGCRRVAPEAEIPRVVRAAAASAVFLLLRRDFLVDVESAAAVDGTPVKVGS
jgi:hypothetical protein